MRCEPVEPLKLSKKGVGPEWKNRSRKESKGGKKKTAHILPKGERETSEPGTLTWGVRVPREAGRRMKTRGSHARLQVYHTGASLDYEEATQG